MSPPFPRWFASFLPFPDDGPVGRTFRVVGRGASVPPVPPEEGAQGCPRAADAVRSRSGGSMQGTERWEVAPDAGRPQGRACAHRDLLDDVRPVSDAPSAGCQGCLPRGQPWVRLRQCVTCGYTGCCDSSAGRHSYGHHEESGHPVAVSLAPDEEWAWCFTDEVFLIRTGRNTAGPPAGGPRH
ncbi:UBP-type zinc finger domain-containing protein [Streptomyces sp. NPDC058874]|uniref:UBP-type zinc finger domain-containing protein n=2 Tax=unclassified Streptomyces TaxID=2593676 RepID=UPI0036AF92BB